MRRTLGRKNTTKDIKTVRALNKLPDTSIACRVYRDVDFTHDSTGNYLAIIFNNERRDSYAMHSVTSNQSRITVRVAGWYYVWGGATFAANATGLRQLGIRLDGSTFLAAATDFAPSASVGDTMSVSTLYYFSASAYVELVAYQNSGGNLAISALANYSPEFAVAKFPFNDNPKTEYTIPRE